MTRAKVRITGPNESSTFLSKDEPGSWRSRSARTPESSDDQKHPGDESTTRPATTLKARKVHEERFMKAPPRGGSFCFLAAAQALASLPASRPSRPSM